MRNKKISEYIILMVIIDVIELKIDKFTDDYDYYEFIE